MTETGVQLDTGEIIETKALICDSRSRLLLGKLRDWFVYPTTEFEIDYVPLGKSP